MQPKVSVIIPVYNIENYLANSLESVLNQSYQQLEIICVNDGSKDGSAQVMSDFAEKDSRIVCVHQENAGVSAARNKGLETATGDYVFFLDGDDYLHPQAIEILVEGAVKTGAQMVCSDYKVTENLSEKGEDYSRYDFAPTDFDTLFKKGNKLGKCCFAKLIKADVAKKVRFFDGVAMGEDGCYIVLLLNENISVYTADKPLYYYYVRQGSATKSVLNEKKLTIVNAYDRLCDILSDSGNAHIKAFALRALFYQLNHKLRLYKGTEFEALAEKTCKQIGKKHLKAFMQEKNISLKVRLMHFLRFKLRFLK
ncbi:MAG: glycosyltransferase family 2 protein [Clostridia bacterium]|nr:glycosyltransferase family 2 protein [Clostridia bacterium]